MPRTLFLLRHAKSSWDDGALRDDERPLSLRGRRAAARMGEHFDATGVAPEIVLCSTAQRTRETWALVRSGLRGQPAVEFRREIYLASADELVGLIRSVRAGIESLMIIGHNPGLEDLADALAGHSDDAVAQLARGFPTGAFAALSLPNSWAETGFAAAHLDHLVRPRELPDTIKE